MLIPETTTIDAELLAYGQAREEFGATLDSDYVSRANDAEAVLRERVAELEADRRIVEWCVAHPSSVPSQWGRNGDRVPLWIFDDEMDVEPIPGTWRDAVASRLALTTTTLETNDVE